jgi:hypothetical protein
MPQFHPPHATATLLAFFPSGFRSVCALGCPSPSWGFDPCKVLLRSRMARPLARSCLPSWIFLPFDANFHFEDVEHSRLLIPFRLR